jgi:hypothetical protein
VFGRLADETAADNQRRRPRRRGIAYKQKQTADEQQQVATEQQRIATARQLLAQANAIGNSDPRTAESLALAANHPNPPVLRKSLRDPRSRADGLARRLNQSSLPNAPARDGTVRSTGRVKAVLRALGSVTAGDVLRQDRGASGYASAC